MPFKIYAHLFSDDVHIRLHYYIVRNISGEMVRHLSAFEFP